MRLEGKFVDLRPLEPEDAEITLGWRLGPRARLLNAGSQTVDEQRQWICSRPASEFNFVVELTDGRPVGMISLLNVNLVSRHGEPARFLIGEEEAVRGIPAAVEALKLLYQLAFDRLGLQRIYGTVVAENRRMARLHEYLGMRQEGRLRRHLLIEGAFRDVLLYGLLEEEFRAETLPRMEALLSIAYRVSEERTT